MQPIVLVARVMIAGVFAIAAFAKLADRAGTSKTLVDFGIPDVLARSGAVILPLLELAVAIALLPVASSWIGSIGALVLLILFSFAVALNLVLGRRPECNCFGQLQSEPIGWPTLIRNLALSIVAGFVVWQGSVEPAPTMVQWLGELTIAERVSLFGVMLSLGLLAALVVLTLQLLRQQGRLLLRLDAIETRLTGGTASSVVKSHPLSSLGLPLGTVAPPFALDTLSGESMTLDALTAAGKPTLLLFTNPNCGPCEALLPDAVQWQRQHSPELTIAFVTEGSPKDIQDKIASRALGPVLLQRQREVADIYQALGTPAAVLIGRDGTIASLVAHGADKIRNLVARAAGSAQ